MPLVTWEINIKATPAAHRNEYADGALCKPLSFNTGLLIANCMSTSGIGSAIRPGLSTELHDAKEIPMVFSVTPPERPTCNCDDLPCMGFPGNSHETAIFELGIPIGISPNSTPGIPASGIPGP